MSGSVSRRRRVREFTEIKNFSTLDELLEALVALRNTLPDNHEAELRLRGDDFFGRSLTISWFRDQTDEELQAEAKYRKKKK